MSSHFNNDEHSIDEPARQAPDDAVALSDQLGRLERLIDSLQELATDTKMRDVQQSLQLEQLQELTQQFGQARPDGSGEAGSTKDSQTSARQSKNDSGQTGKAKNPKDSEPLKGWQQQRQELLDAEGNGEADAPVKNEIIPAVSRNIWETGPVLDAATIEDLNEIQQLKNQLKKALQDAETEFSMERARLGNEKLALDKRANDLDRREKESERKKDQKTADCDPDKRVSRLKNFLSRKKSS